MQSYHWATSEIWFDRRFLATELSNEVKPLIVWNDILAVVIYMHKAVCTVQGRSQRVRQEIARRKNLQNGCAPWQKGHVCQLRALR
jgi:hypothetical protein